MKKVVIIGGGFAGCAASHQFILDGGWDISIIEKSNFLGAGNRTFYYGGHPYTYGPRHFLTPWENVYDYLNKLIPIRLCKEHEFLTYVETDNNFYSFPINEDDIPRMPENIKIRNELSKIPKEIHPENFEEYWIQSIGPTLYNKFINKYSKKMWQIEDNQIIDTFNWSPKGVALKKGGRAAWDNAISGYPFALDGYDKYFDLSTSGTNIYLNTLVKKINYDKKTISLDKNKVLEFDILVNTISPDEIMENEFGELPYMGRDLQKVVLPIEHAMPSNVYFTYYAGLEKYTRIVEYKKFTQFKSNSTLLGIEYPSKNGKFYPVPLSKNFILAEKYFNEMPDYMYSMGRNGCYRYGCDIDDCIFQAFELMKCIKNGGRDHPVPGRTKETALRT